MVKQSKSLLSTNEIFELKPTKWRVVAGSSKDENRFSLCQIDVHSTQACSQYETEITANKMT